MTKSTGTTPEIENSADMPAKHRRKTRRLGIVAATFVTVMGSAVAFAAWTSSGTGDSQEVVAGTAAGLSVSAITPALTGLVPGESRNSAFEVTNNNAYQVTLSAASVLSFTVTGGTGCNQGNSGVTGTISPSAVGTVVAGGGTPVSSPNFTVSVSMDATSIDGCQGASFKPNLSVSGASS